MNCEAGSFVNSAVKRFSGIVPGKVMGRPWRLCEWRCDLLVDVLSYIDPGPCNKKPFSGNPIRIGTHAQTSYCRKIFFVLFLIFIGKKTWLRFMS